MRFVLGLLFVLVINFAKGQTVSLPDENLRDKLLTDYPEVMEGNELSVPKAAAFTGKLDLKFANISDASGIQYFTGIHTLDLANNNLTTIPDISAITGLLNFYASHNKLTSLPDMSSLTNLIDFQVMNNQLTALPDLSGATGLHSIYCSGNKITSFPSLSQFPNLINLVIGDNPFEGPIDFSSCVNLEELHVHKTGVDTIIGLENLKKLKVLYAWENSIKNFSGLDSNTTLNICVIFDNPVSDLPYLGNKDGLYTLNVNNCQLTFEDILPVLQQGPPSIFNYKPQRPVLFDNMTSRAGKIFTLKYPENAPHPDNIYVWMHNNVVLDSSSSSEFTFSPLELRNEGRYRLKVYNTNFTEMNIESGPFYLAVKPCIELNLPNVYVIDKDCENGYRVDLSNAMIAGGTEPFTYELNNGVQREKFSDLEVEGLSAGNYEFTVIDSKNCTATDKFVLNKIEKCDPVLTPNGDGIADSYFIDKPGSVRIYDLRRKLVKTLEAPALWDGTNNNGALLDAGLYILIQEGEVPVNITIIR